MTFSWYFLPGSQVLIAWKNSIYSNSDMIINNFYENFNNTLSLPTTNSFSVKLLYYIDYQYLKRKL